MVPQTKVFVGSLPAGSKPEELRRLFERYGVVTECDVMNRCGFVHMQTEDMASEAIRALNGTSFNGGVITVERGRIKERARGGGRGAPMGGGGGRGGGPVRGSGPGGHRDRPYGRPQGELNRVLTGPGAVSASPAQGQLSVPAVRIGGGYERSERRPAYDDSADGYAPPESRAPSYGAPYQDDRRSYGYERGAPRSANPSGNGDMFSRRSPPQMRTGTGSETAGYADRDPYAAAQQYPPSGRVGGSGPRGGREEVAGPRRY